ncbi:MAG: hypothetical protein QOG50_3167 [Actinomycetota bacterium]|nr:hypothetical protein [Actinomycetota bacterium]
MGPGWNHRMVDLATGEVIFGKKVGWSLPDGRDLTDTLSQGRPGDHTYELTDASGTVVMLLSWLPPFNPRRGRFPLGRAALARGLEPTHDLVPLTSYVFQLFTYRSTPHRGG